MKPKLSKEEYEALLGAFSIENFRLRKLSEESKPFKIAYLFVNIYSIVMIAAYVIITQFFLEHVNKELIESGYVKALGARAFLFAWMLFGFNAAYFFGLAFRLVTLVIFLFTIDVTFQYIFTLQSTYSLPDLPLLGPYIISRPIFMLALAFILYTYRDS